MTKLILGIICTIIAPIVMIRSIREVRKYESSFQNSKKHSPKSDYQTGGLNKTRLVVAGFTFFLGLYLLYEYFVLS